MRRIKFLGMSNFMCGKACLSLEPLEYPPRRPRVRGRDGLPQKKIILKLLSWRHSNKQEEETRVNHRLEYTSPFLGFSGSGVKFPGTAFTSHQHRRLFHRRGSDMHWGACRQQRTEDAMATARCITVRSRRPLKFRRRSGRGRDADASYANLPLCVLSGLFLSHTWFGLVYDVASSCFRPPIYF